MRRVSRLEIIALRCVPGRARKLLWDGSEIRANERGRRQRVHRSRRLQELCCGARADISCGIGETEGCGKIRGECGCGRTSALNDQRLAILRHSERSEESLFMLCQIREGFLAALGMTALRSLFLNLFSDARCASSFCLPRGHRSTSRSGRRPADYFCLA